MEALQSGSQHRPVGLASKPVGDVHDAARVDPEQVAIEREVVDRAQGEAVHHRGDALGIDVGHDVGSLDERALAQRRISCRETRLRRWRS
jgi:hypothetical protein